MISAAADYEYVDTTGLSAFITGGILPVRMASADGSERVLRYEDYLFLLEGYYERANWNASPSVSVQPSGRVLDETAMLGATILSATANPAGFVNAAVTLPTAVAAAQSSASVAAALGLSNAPLLSPTYSDKPLSKEEVCKSFWNLKLCKRTLVSLQVSALATETMNYVFIRDDSSQGASGSSSGAWSGGVYTTNYASIVGSRNNRYALATSSSPLVAAAPWASAATLMLLVQVMVTPKGGSATYSYWVYPITCTISSGMIATPTLNAATIASAVATAASVNYSSTPYYEASTSVAITVTGAAVVVENDFPAEFDSVNWSWNPS